ncbi:MAG: beta-lactamase family protein [Flavobacteriia bacterium]|nr:beta-lactamase family protein [Flavobacteriia bacterium]
MKKNVFLLMWIFFCFQFKAQSLYFPPNNSEVWDTLSPDSMHYCPDKIQELYTYLDNTHSKAFILLKDGKIVLEKYFYSFTKDSLHVWNSAGKTLTALAIGIAHEEGYLSIYDKTSQYLGQGWTSLSIEQEEKIKIWHQLTMTSGLNHIGDHYCTLPECLVYEAEPGTRWMYHNAPYTLLDSVIYFATGTNLNQYVNAKILSKIGMNGLFFPIGYNNIFISKPRSMARYGLLLLNRGLWNTTYVANHDFIDSMTTKSQDLNKAYGFLTWLNGNGSYMLPSPDVQYTVNENPLPNAPMDLYAAMGKDGQILNIVPSQNLILVRMGDNDGNSLVSTQYNDTIWQYVNELQCNLSTSKINLNHQSIYYDEHNQKLIFKNSEYDELYLCSVLGEKYPINTIDFQISTEKLNSGLYFLTYKENQQLKTFRFVKK